MKFFFFCCLGFIRRPPGKMALLFFSLHLDALFLGMHLEGESEKCLLPGSGVIAWKCKASSAEL